MLFHLVASICVLLAHLAQYSATSVPLRERENIAKPRILLVAPLGSFFTSHLLGMERLGEFYADNGYDVYLLGTEFLQSRQKSVQKLHLLIYPLLQPDDPAERERLMHQSDNYIDEKLRPLRYFGYIVNRGLLECESILRADGGHFLRELKSYNFQLIFFEFDCGLILADYLGIPKIVVDGAGVAPVYRSFVNLHLASFPLMVLPYSNEMSLTQRTVNVALYTILNTMATLVAQPAWTRLYNEQLKTNYGDLTESYYNTSMVFVNTRREFEYPIALMPNVLPIGCAFLKQHDSSILGADITDFISGQKVIYVSFGTLHEFTPNEYHVIMNALSMLTSYRIVWQTRHKFASSLSVAEHVRLVSWIDQPTILSRSETLLFVGHGGLNSAMGSAYYGVPYVVIPLLIDQFYNCRRVQVHQMGRCIHREELTEASLLELIQEMLLNPLYKRNAMKLSRGMQSHDVKKDILYWTEMVIEHKGWPFVETPFKRLPWYSYFLLDVILVISVVFISMLSILFLCCRCMKRCCCGKAKAKVE